MGHPLDGAFARIDRTDTHFRELASIIERFRKSVDNAFISQKKAEALNLEMGQRSRVTFASSAVVDIPAEAAVVVGEVIYNLRAALDYLIYELARKDSGCEQKGTQFPIQQAKDGNPPDCRYFFSDRSLKQLRGLSHCHVLDIQRLQPYSGCAWTETLREISNPDKHRNLIVLGGGRIQWGTFAKGPIGSFDDYPGKTIRVGDAEINIHFENFINVTLPDGQTPIMEQLEILQREVAATIDAFKPEF